MGFYIGVNIRTGHGFHGGYGGYGGCFPPVQPVFYNQGYYGGFARPGVFGAASIHLGAPRQNYVTYGAPSPELDPTEYRNLSKTINTADHWHPGMPRVDGELAYTAMESLREALLATHGEKHAMDFLKEAWKSTAKLPEGEIRNKAIINIMDRLATGGSEKHLNAYVQPRPQPQPPSDAKDSPPNQNPLNAPRSTANIVAHEVFDDNVSAKVAIQDLVRALRVPQSNGERLSSQKSAQITIVNSYDTLGTDAKAQIGKAALDFQKHKITADDFGDRVENALKNFPKSNETEASQLQSIKQQVRSL